MTASDPGLIGVVGPCAAGKSTLVDGLVRHGYRAQPIAQEHSYVADMWQRLTRPDVLVFLDASYPVTCQRRDLRWNESDYAEQQRRLNHARQHAQLVIDTSGLTIAEVLKRALAYLKNIGQ